MLKPGGQLLFDSSDVAYLKKDFDLPEKDYYGEIDYRYEYKGELSDWFSWLYVDESKLINIAQALGWNAQIIFRNEEQQYLARLTK